MIIATTIDRFEGDKAVLKTEDNQEIIWPKSKLPQAAKEGASFLIALSNSNDSDSKQLAKVILNEIFNAE